MASGQSDSPTVREPPTAHERWVLLHGGQGSISLEYQTYTSAHPFDTLVAGMGDDELLIGNVNLQETEATFHCTNSFLL